MCERYINQLPLTRPQLRTWPTTQACVLTENRISDLSVHKPALNRLSHTSQCEGVLFGKLLYSTCIKVVLLA